MCQSDALRQSVVLQGHLHRKSNLRLRSSALCSVLLGLGIVAFDSDAAFAQNFRGPVGRPGGYYGGGGGGGYFGGGGFGLPIIIPVPRAPAYEPDDEDVIYERPRPRRVPRSQVEIVDDGPVRQVRRPKRKSQREVVETRRPEAKPKIKTTRVVPPVRPTRPALTPVVPPVPPLAGTGGPPSGNGGLPPANETRFVQNEVVFEFRPLVDPQVIDNVIAANKLERIASWKFRLTDSIIFRYRITDGRPVSAVIAALEQTPGVLSAQPNYIYSLQQASPPVVPASSSSLPAQYSVNVMHVVDAHKLARGTGILVSVIDSGIDTNHPEMKGVVTETFDPIGGTARPDSHGTAMSGAIAAQGQLTGLAPDAHVLAVRAFTSKDSPIEEVKKNGAEATTFHILRGLDWSYERQARVVNMSFAGPRDPALSRMIAAATGKKMVVIAAAGNAGAASPPLYPAADANVIAVTATDPENRLYTNANRGKYISVAAPGVDVVVASPGGSYDFSTGTSVATAHVSGLAALILQKQPDLDSDGVKKLLIRSAKSLNAADKTDAGLVDAIAAVKAAGGQ